MQYTMAFSLPDLNPIKHFEGILRNMLRIIILPVASKHPIRKDLAQFGRF